jgi:hypothetical protein
MEEYYMSEDSIVYFVGEARTNTNNAITKIYNSFILGLIVDMDTAEILDFGCSHTIKVTERFLASIFIGKHIGIDDEIIEQAIESRYLGSSKKAAIVAYRDVVKKFETYQR